MDKCHALISELMFDLLMLRCAGKGKLNPARRARCSGNVCRIPPGCPTPKQYSYPPKADPAIDALSEARFILTTDCYRRVNQALTTWE